MLRKNTLTTGEVAKFCDVHRRTVIRWIEKGKIKAYKFPGRGDRRVLKEDLIKFLKQNNFPVPIGDTKKEKRLVLTISNDCLLSEIIQKMIQDIYGFETRCINKCFLAGIMMDSLNPHIIILDLETDENKELETLRGLVWKLAFVMEF